MHTHAHTRTHEQPLLQAQVVVLEQDHSPARLEAEEQQLELQQEVERLRSAQVQTERTLEARERAHQQRVRGLEEQVLGPDGAPAPPQGPQSQQASSPGKLEKEGEGEGWVSPLGSKQSVASKTEMVRWCEPWLTTGLSDVIELIPLPWLCCPLALGRPAP